MKKRPGLLVIVFFATTLFGNVQANASPINHFGNVYSAEVSQVSQETAIKLAGPYDYPAPPPPMHRPHHPAPPPMHRPHHPAPPPMHRPHHPAPPPMHRPHHPAPPPPMHKPHHPY